MRSHDSLGERLREILDRIAEVECAEWRCNPQRAFSNMANRMTRCAMGPGERASALNPRLLGLACGRYEERTPRKLTALFSSLVHYIEASDVEERLEHGVACFAPIKPDDEFVEVVLQVNPSLSVVKPPGPSA